MGGIYLSTIDPASGYLLGIHWLGQTGMTWNAFFKSGFPIGVPGPNPLMIFIAVSIVQ